MFTFCFFVLESAERRRSKGYIFVTLTFFFVLFERHVMIVIYWMNVQDEEKKIESKYGHFKKVDDANKKTAESTRQEIELQGGFDAAVRRLKQEAEESRERERREQERRVQERREQERREQERRERERKERERREQERKEQEAKEQEAMRLAKGKAQQFQLQVI